MADDMAKRVQQFVTVRDKLKELEEEYDAKRRPLVEVQLALQARIEKFMDENNLTNFKSEHGTAHFTTRYTASLSDPEAFMSHVIATKDFDLLDRRANATAVRAFVEKQSTLPPGCNLNAIRTVGVRRK